MPLYIKMDQNRWVNQDFTDSNSYDLSGTVYSEPEFTNTVDISSYTTVTLRVINNDGNVLFSTTDNITANSDGTILFKFGVGKTPFFSGAGTIRVRFEDSTNRLTAVGVNGSDIVYFEHD